MVENIGNKMSSFSEPSDWLSLHLQMLVSAIAYSAGVDGSVVSKLLEGSKPKPLGKGLRLFPPFSNNGNLKRKRVKFEGWELR